MAFLGVMAVKASLGVMVVITVLCLMAHWDVIAVLGVMAALGMAVLVVKAVLSAL